MGNCASARPTTRREMRRSHVPVQLARALSKLEGARDKLQTELDGQEAEMGKAQGDLEAEVTAVTAYFRVVRPLPARWPARSPRARWPAR